MSESLLSSRFSRLSSLSRSLERGCAAHSCHSPRRIYLSRFVMRTKGQNIKRSIWEMLLPEEVLCVSHDPTSQTSRPPTRSHHGRNVGIDPLARPSPSEPCLLHSFR